MVKATQPDSAMTTSTKLRVAVVGLRFGAEFVPVYLDHPDVASVAICDLDEQRLSRAGEKFGVRRRFRDVAEAIASSDFDAVHLVSGIPDHAAQAVAVLNSGKHCACTVPMATSLDDLRAIVDAQRRSGRNYSNEETQLSFKHGGGHHGSHPHLVHEFVRSIVEGRRPWIDAATAANWTAAGICADESAMRGGEPVEVPQWY